MPYLHHAEMLCTVMSLEQGVSSPAFYQNTTQRPDIDSVTPAYLIISKTYLNFAWTPIILTESQDNLRSPVVSSADHRAVVFIIEGSTPEIYQVDFWT